MNNYGIEANRFDMSIFERGCCFEFQRIGNYMTFTFWRGGFVFGFCLTVKKIQNPTLKNIQVYAITGLLHIDFSLLCFWDGAGRVRQIYVFLQVPQAWCWCLMGFTFRDLVACSILLNFRSNLYTCVSQCDFEILRQLKMSGTSLTDRADYFQNSDWADNRMERHGCQNKQSGSCRCFAANELFVHSNLQKVWRDGLGHRQCLTEENSQWDRKQNDGAVSLTGYV